MKRKTLFLLSILTISATLLSGCKSVDSVDSSETIETTAIESEITEEIETVSETETEFILETETAKDGTPEATNSEGLTVEEALDADDNIIGYKYVNMGKMMNAIKKGVDPLKAIEDATGTYGRFNEAAKVIDPREE